MFENEMTWDKLLHIKTTGRDDSNSDQYRYPYEPTPYKALERFANSGLIRKEDVVLDYGCGRKSKECCFGSEDRFCTGKRGKL